MDYSDLIKHAQECKVGKCNQCSELVHDIKDHELPCLRNQFKQFKKDNDKKYKRIEIKLANELKDFKDNLFTTFENNNKIVQAIWNEIRSILSKIEEISTNLQDNKTNITNLNTSLNSLIESDKNINCEITDVKNNISSLQILSSKVNALRSEVSSNQIHRINTKSVNLTVG